MGEERSPKVSGQSHSVNLLVRQQIDLATSNENFWLSTLVISERKSSTFVKVSKI